MWIKRLRRTQPPTKKKVLEFIVGGWLGKLLYKHNWRAITTCLPFLVVILYWTDKDPIYDFDADSLVRYHEFVHVAQDESNPFFLVTWAKYIWSSYKHFPFVAWWYNHESFAQAWMDAYWNNVYEAEAYAKEAEAQKDGLPTWAK
jgi:hypothetical protein